MTLRDKTYVRIDTGTLFNVTGYRHPLGRVFASLKYIDGQKWKSGYEAAKQFLRKHDPELIENGFISIPLARIAEVFDPQTRWAELQQADNAPLHREAVRLGSLLRQILQIPASKNPNLDTEMGITDSLLWGNGHDESDIDLVVVGRDNGIRLATRAEEIYQHPGFERPDPKVMMAPYGLSVTEWPRILSRKLHMGSYQGRLFSVRVVLREEEVMESAYVTPLSQERCRVRFEVCDTSDSILFPAIYRDATGNHLVDYSVVYEGVFRASEVVECEGFKEEFRTGSWQFVIEGDVSF